MKRLLFFITATLFIFTVSAVEIVKYPMNGIIYSLEYSDQNWKEAVRKGYIDATVTHVGSYLGDVITIETDMFLTFTQEGNKIVIRTTGIGDSLFYNRKDVTIVNFPEYVANIGEAAFMNSEALAYILLPDSLETIGKSAFWGCQYLYSIKLPKNTKSIGEKSFSNISELYEFEVAPENQYFSALNGVLYDKEQTTLVVYPYNRSNSFEIPNTVETIAGSAFNYCQKLASVKIPYTVTKIGSEAFGFCTSLKDITVHWDSPLAISADAFKGLNLADINLHVPVGKSGSYSQAAVWKDMNIIDDARGIDAAYIAMNARIYPNPVRDGFTVLTGFSGLIELSLTDALGRTVFTRRVSDGDYVNISPLPKGVYILSLSAQKDGIMKIEKIIKK